MDGNHTGQIVFRGQNLLEIKERDLKALRGDRMAMIFQEPMTALNPCYTVGNQIDEIFKKYRKISTSERKERVLKLLNEVLSMMFLAQR
jgi:peptide/nickel transport system ATP-binding protein